MNQEEIKKILPHRDNMLLVEEAESVDENTAKADIQSKVTSSFYRDISPVTPLFLVLFSAK